MKRVIIAIGGLVAGWLWSRGHRDPRQWVKRLPGEVAALWDDLDDAFAAARRESVRQQRDFEDELRRVKPEGS